MIERIWVIIFCAAAVTGDAALAKTVDLSSRSDATGTYEVAFCARPSPEPKTHLPGHMFVAFSHEGADGKRDFLAIGHTVAPGTGPREATWSYFGDAVSGYLAEEKYEAVRQKCLDVIVNKEDYERAFAMTQSPLRKMGLVRSDGPVFEAYKLGAEDCMSFLIEAATLIKLNVPERRATDLPMSYVERLINAN